MIPVQHMLYTAVYRYVRAHVYTYVCMYKYVSHGTKPSQTMPPPKVERTEKEEQEEEAEARTTVTRTGGRATGAKGGSRPSFSAAERSRPTTRCTIYPPAIALYRNLM